MFPAGRSEFRTRYLTLRSGLKTRAVECGSETDPTVLLIHGWACSAYVFRENFVALAKAGYHAIAVELKGHGLSDKPTSPSEYRLEPMRTHVEEIVDALGGSVIMCGLSMGAALGAHVAARSPERVRALVMVSPVGFFGVPGLSVIRLATPLFVTRYLRHIVRRSTIQLMLGFMNGRLREITPQDVDEYWAPSQFPEFIAATRHLLHEFDLHAPIVPLHVPLLIITGSRDYFMSGQSVRTYCEAMPSARHIEIRNAGHVVLDEAAPIVNDAMIEFFASATKAA
ncbi:MAG TPA: alpha/beta hydrolase [Gemmatimonadaceae bacterium]|nr:alpha/beta hydrolase [Gemmatimonadaceae bacterium]